MQDVDTKVAEAVWHELLAEKESIERHFKNTERSMFFG